MRNLLRLPEHKTQVPAYNVDKSLANPQSHGLKPPSAPGSEEFQRQFEHTLILTEEAKYDNFSPTTQDVLLEHLPDFAKKYDLAGLMSRFGYSSWRQIVFYVENDICVESAVAMHKVVKNEWRCEPVKKGFRQGDHGLNFHKKLVEEMDVMMAKGGDVKYYFEAPRPFDYLVLALGSEQAARAIINYMHPGHNRFLAWHAIKFYISKQRVEKSYILSKEQAERNHLRFAIEALGRAGGTVHFPEDCTAGGAVCGEEDKIYKNMLA